MKYFNKTVITLLITTIILSACKPDSFKDLGIERDFLESLNGTWKLTKATQVDEKD